MTSYSAMDAISPAIERTKYFLFKPFRLGRFLKLALVACFAEGSYSGFNSNFNIPFPGKTPEHVPFQIPQVHWPDPGIMIAIAAVILIFFVPLTILISYLLIRLRFSYFDCVLYGHDQITPGWRKYHRQALRYLGVNLLIGLAFLAVLAAMGIVVWQRYKEVFMDLAAGNKAHVQVDLMSLLPAIALAFLILFVMGIVGYIVQSAMTYFVLPRMALEDASISRSFADVWDDMKSEPGQFALFLLMRMLLAIAAGLIAMIALLLPIVILGVIGVVIGLVVHATVHSTVALVVLAVVGALILAAVLFVCAISIGGTIGTFTRNYGLLFYAGRYPELGALLLPAPPVPGFPVVRPGEVL